MLLTGSNGYAQLITVLVIFVLVLAVTAGVTKWLANYQKGQGCGRNIEIIETSKVAVNKWVEIIRVGDTYKVIAVSKDQVTFLGDIDPAEIKTETAKGKSSAFKSVLKKVLNKDDASEKEKESSLFEKAGVNKAGDEADQVDVKKDPDE